MNYSDDSFYGNSSTVWPFLQNILKVKKKIKPNGTEELIMKNNSCLPFPPHSPTPCSATERHSLLSVSVFRSKVYLNNVLILFCLDLSTSDIIFWRLAMMDEDLALYSSLSCCRLSPESGDAWLLFICENEGQRSIRGGSVFMGSHWKLWLEWEWRLGVAAGHRAVGFWNARMLELSLLGYHQRPLLLLFS